jgi:leader peptidase (prepilin peptidase)/N-methyltransferase
MFLGDRGILFTMESIDIVFLGFLFLFGMIVGSFLNVVIYRFGSGIGLRGRSKCLACGKTLSARMLIPVVSYLCQRGKCAHCGAKLSLQYPLVEILSGALVLSTALVNDFTFTHGSSYAALMTGLEAVVWMILLTVTVYDLKHKIIPDRLSFLFAFVSGILLLIKYQYGVFPEQYIPIFDVVPPWIDAFAGPLLFLPFAGLWYLSGGRAMGLGDAKLSWGIGWFLGFSGGVSALVLGFWIAFFPSLFLLFVRGKHFTMKSEIPFAPFLVLGTLVVYLFGVDLLTWTLP